MARRKPRAQPIVIAAASDIHAGSSRGLCPAGGIELDGQALYQPGPKERARWHFWEEFWATVRARQDEVGGRLGVLLNGDLTDGAVFRDQELITRSPGEQVDIAVQCLAPMLDLKPSKVWISRGTPVHVGMHAGLEQAVARRIGAEKDPDTGSWAAYRWLIEAHGRRIFATHHPPSAGRLVRTRKSQAALTANEVASRFTERRGPDGQPLTPPDLAIFSHKHEPEDSGPVMPHRIGTRVLLLGAWQRKTSYAEKVASVALGGEANGFILTVWPDPARPIGVEAFARPLQTVIPEVQA